MRCSVLGQRRAGGEFTEDLLESALAGARLSPADRDLCQELVYGIVRWQATLDWLIARKTGRARAKRPACKTCCGSASTRFSGSTAFPTTPPSTKPSNLPSKAASATQAGFVNAVLRGYLRESDATRKLLADLKATDRLPAIRIPNGWLPAGRKHFGAEKTAQLLEWNNTPPKTFARVNTLKPGSAASRRRSDAERGGSQRSGRLRAKQIENAGDLLTRWREENVEYDFVRRDWLEENLVFELKSHPSLNSLASFRDGWFYVQDPGTLLAPRELGPQPGETILDLCAAPGGKTTFIAQLMNNEGKIIACDISEERLKLIRENCQRLGVTCVEPDFRLLPAYQAFSGCQPL